MRRKRKTENWADFDDDICALADQAYPKLGAEGRQQLALHQYLANLSNPQVAFAVRQKKLSTVKGAVAATLETESFLLPVGGLGRIAHVGVEEQQETQESLVAAVKTQQDIMVDLMSKLVDRLERLEAQDPGHAGDRTVMQRNPQRAGSREGSATKTVYCHNCGQEGYSWRGCAKPKQHGKSNPSV